MEKAGQKTVVIIGGGITGLSAAYDLEQAAQKQGSLRVILLEAESRLGGKVQTEVRDGLVIEKGPDSFLARKSAAVNLITELGMREDLVGQNPHNKKTYILHNNKLHRIPAGLNSGIPTQFVPFATTSLLSWAGKLRAGLDFVLPRNQVKGDQSLGGFLERRLGKEVVDRVAEPLFSGVYAGDLRKLSLQATFPQFQALEQKYRSMIRGMLAQARAAKSQQAGKATAYSAAGNSGTVTPLPNSVFLSLRGGLISLIDRLAQSLQRTEVRLGGRVVTIHVTPAQPATQAEVILESGERILADAVIITTPTHQAARFFTDSTWDKVRPYLQAVPYATVATVALTYDRKDIDFPLDGTGFVVARTEKKRTITASTWTSSKWEHVAPDDTVLIRCYVGREGDSQIVNESDEEILRRVRGDLKETMGIDVLPKTTAITRWRDSMPQYLVGHLDRIQELKTKAAEIFPGLYFAGASIAGVGLPDCIAQGKEAAEQVVQQVVSTNP